MKALIRNSNTVELAGRPLGSIFGATSGHSAEFRGPQKGQFLRCQGVETSRPWTSFLRQVLRFPTIPTQFALSWQNRTGCPPACSQAGRGNRPILATVSNWTELLHVGLGNRGAHDLSRRQYLRGGVSFSVHQFHTWPKQGGVTPPHRCKDDPSRPFPLQRLFVWRQHENLGPGHPRVVLQN